MCIKKPADFISMRGESDGFQILKNSKSNHNRTAPLSKLESEAAAKIKSVVVKKFHHHFLL